MQFQPEYLNMFENSYAAVQGNLLWNSIPVLADIHSGKQFSATIDSLQVQCALSNGYSCSIVLYIL